MIKSPTDEQREIIDYPGNIVVTAKPGSGKTFTIVEKIANVLPGLPDYKGVIAISFTNKASDELKRRCKQRCKDTKQSFFGTIDKFYLSQIIMPFACHITGVKKDYEVIEDIPEEGKYSSLLQYDSVLTQLQKDLLIYGLYDGIVFLKYIGETALLIIERISNVILYLKAKYSHVIIDEYQDCGAVQHSIFEYLVENGLIGIAVGDINQAIYGFSNRFPKYLLSLMSKSNYTVFHLNKNHRCHPSISEYSLCLFDASKTVPTEKRVFRVSVNGDEEIICQRIDQYIEAIKNKYNVANNNQIAILCRGNSTINRIDSYLKTHHKVYNETVIDKDTSEWGRLFRDILISHFEEKIFSADYVEKYFSEEIEPHKYKQALSVIDGIFSTNPKEFFTVAEKMIAFAELIYPNKRNKTAIANLQRVLSSEEMLSNYFPAAKDEINIMTLHKSKGLEFNIVFHMDMYKWVLSNEYGNEEEKQQNLNLHYVGVTRAIDVCYIMLGSKRYNSKGKCYDAFPSSFLEKQELTYRRVDVKW